MTLDLSEYLEFPDRFLSRVKGGVVQPIFQPDGRRFGYTEGSPDRATAWLVNPGDGTREPLLDTERTRKALEAEFAHPLPFHGLPFANWEFVDERTIRVVVQRQPVGLLVPDEAKAVNPDAVNWLVDVDLKTYQVVRGPFAEQLRSRRAQPRCLRPGVAPGDPGLHELGSPDGRWFLGERDANLVLRSVIDDRTVPLTDDGEGDNAWSMEHARWSGDSMRLAVTRSDARRCGRMPVVHWLQPYEEVRTHPMTRTGGRRPITTAAVLDVHSRQAVEITIEGEPDQSIVPAGWRHDGAEAYFLATDRRQRYLRLFAADPLTGGSRLVCEETQDTFVLGIRQVERFSPRMILAGDECLLWYSERDGWRHLYLYRTDGTTLAQVTSGDFEVLSVVAVDLEQDAVFFTAHSDLDQPYDAHLCRARLDGSEFRQLTSETGVHAPIASPDAAYFLDIHSAIGRPPRTDLLTADGTALMMLSEADVSELAGLDITPPEPFTVDASDGATVLHGVLYRPPGFDPSKRYPVIEDIYGGPQVAVHQTSFADIRGIQSMAKASLGFVVYSVDGRGTPGRGKAFQDVVYGRFHEFHVEDHRHVLEQLLARYPFMDPGRVGVAGPSWGGYHTVRTLLSAPDHYHVGVAICPVHDFEDHAADALEPYMGLPIDRPEAYAAGSNLDIVDRLQGRLLLIHGTSDVNASFSATMKMCEALARADKPYDLVVMPRPTTTSAEWETITPGTCCHR